MHARSKTRPTGPWVAWSVVALALASPACRRSDSQTQAAPSAEPAADGAALDNVWDAYYLKGAKIGYGHTLVRPVKRAGRNLLDTTSLNHLKIERFGQSVEQELKLGTLETSDGQLLEFDLQAAFGPTPVSVTGRVEGGELVIQSKSEGVRHTALLAWSDEIRGFFGVEQSLERQPLAPGGQRTLRMLVPLVNQVAEVTLVAHDFEATPVLDGSRKLLRIESVARLPDGNEMAETLWADPRGQIVKRRIDGMQQESYRTSREQALADGRSGATFDLGTDTLVKVDQPLSGGHQTRRVRYRVELASGDPAKAFSTGPTQSVRSLGPHAAEIVVRSLRPGDATSRPDAKTDAAVPAEYTAANSMLQVDDPRIQKMAAEARGDLTDPLEIARALERYVQRIVVLKDFSQSLASAAEVAETRQGDCTEHAVLLAALARACHIPSRVSIGLVYVEPAGGFGFHMWTEMYLDGQWIPMDATLGQGGIGAAHLKLIDSSLDGTSAYSAFLPVAQVVGQLKIDVLEAE